MTPSPSDLNRSDAPEELVTARNQASHAKEKEDFEDHPVITQASPIPMSIELLPIQRVRSSTYFGLFIAADAEV